MKGDLNMKCILFDCMDEDSVGISKGGNATLIPCYKCIEC